MKSIRVTVLLLICLLGLILALAVRNTGSHTARPTGSGTAAGIPAKSQTRTVSPVVEDLPKAVAEAVQAAPLEPVAAEPEQSADWVKRTISEEWVDGPGKLAGRQRVRIVEADFKYPRIRLEESVTTDPKTGLEQVKLLRASVADHLMLGLRHGADPREAVAALREKGYPVRAMEAGSYVLAELPESDTAGAQAKAVADIASLDEFIDYAEPDYLVFPSIAPNDPAYGQGKMWGLNNPGTTADSLPDADIDAPEGWGIRNDASDIVVAVTDTGIQYNHEDLSGNMWVSPTDGSHGFDAYDDDNDPMDTGGHGTHCAGTIGGTGNNAKGLTGVAWDVQLMGVRFLGPNGGTTSDAIRVVNFARLNGANIISASWGGGGFSQSLFNAISACGDAGIPFVAAAGNDSLNNDSCPHYPSSYNLANIVAVASTTQKDVLSYFSCYGRTSVDIAAPGSGIWSSYIGSNASYTFLNGTSMATPHVSGALALAMAQFPSEDMTTIIARLYESVDKIPALAGKVSTGGRLNLARLLGGSPPSGSNDDFADALIFEQDYGFWSGTSSQATREADEDQFAVPNSGGIHSLWFGFHTAHAGLVSLNAFSNVSGYRMIVFEGSTKGSLKEVADSKFVIGTFYARLSFTSKPNTHYRVVLDDRRTGGQLYSLRYNLSPINDFFADATEVSGDFFSVKGTNRSATAESFEQSTPHAGTGRGKSIWWKWTAPADGDFTINTAGSGFDTVLAVYTGTNTGSLTEIASNDDRSALDWGSQVTFPAVAGTTYQIAVDSFRDDAAGEVTLNGFGSGVLTIIRQPASLSVELGKRAVFEVSVLSGGAVAYQWFLNDNAIPGQTSANLVIDPVRAEDFGSYKVEVSNTENLVTSDTAILSEKQTPPKLVWSSGNQAVASGTALTLAANFSGSTPITYAWTKNGEPLPDTIASLAFLSAQTVDAGLYRLTATNSAGSATADFTLSVVQSPWERWEWRRPGIPNAAITDIKVYGGEAFAIAGTVLFRSSDGTNWTKSLFPQGFSGNSIAKAGSKFLCLGLDQDGQFRVATSSDNAATWTITTPAGFAITYQPEKSSLLAHNGAFIAYNSVSNQYGQDFLRSTDGINWTRLMATSLTSSSINLAGKGNIASDGTTLVLASITNSSNGKMRHFRSTDGIAWQEYETNNPDTSGARYPATAFHDGSKFYLFGTYSIYSSPDGVNWQYHYAPSNGFVYSSLFASNASSLIAFGANSQTMRHFTDPDDRKMRTIQPANSHAFTAAASFGSKVLYGTDKGLLALADGPFDVAIPKEKSSTVASVEFTENLFIARTTNSGSGAVADQVSGDGLTWKQPSQLTSAITYTGSALGRYFGTSGTQTAVYSGHNPFDIRLATDDNIGLAPNITFIGELPNGNALAVSSPSSGSPTLNTRASGATTWSAATFPLGVNSASKFANLGNRWYSNTGSSSSALIYTSTNGTSWTSTGLTGSNPLFATFAGKSWCLYQSASYPYPTFAASSTNGTSWSGAAANGIPTNNNSKFAKRLVSFGSYLVLLGGDENLYFSDNGTTWVRGFTPGKVVDLAVGQGQLVAVMKNGGLIQTGSPHPGKSAPLVGIVSPQNVSTHLIGSRITIEGTVSDPEDGAASYECYLDSQLVASGTGSTFRFQVTTTSLNGHTVTVRAADSQGLRQIDSIRLKVVAPEPPNQLAALEGGTFIPQSLAVAFDGVFYTAGTRSVYRSLDGKSWERVPIPSFANSIYGMASGNGSLVIQFDNGAIITTRDGVNWTHFSPNSTDYWVREPIRFSSGVFIAAYQTQGTTSGSVMTSVDGLRWETGAVSLEGYLSWTANGTDGTIIGAVAYQTGINRTTDNGFNWNPIAQLATGAASNSHGVFADGKFVVAVIGINKILTSSDAIAWTEAPLPAAFGQTPALGHFGGLFFLGASANFSFVSPDASSWQAMSHAVHKQRITHSRGLFVAQASAGGLLTSRDGVTWTPVTVPGMPSTLSKVLSNDSSFLIIDSAGGVWSSPDGSAWENLLPGGTAPSGSGRVGRSIAESNGKLIVAGQTLFVASPDNGSTWANVTVNGQPPSTSNTYHKVVAGGSAVLALEGSFSAANTVLRSTDGASFATVPGMPAKTWADLAWNGTEWMLVATDGTLMRSTDGGITWSQIPSASMPRGAALAWFNGRWVIIGSDTAGFNTPYKGFTLEAGDILQNNGTIGFFNSNYAVRALVAHGKLIIWARGENPFVTSNGTTWTKANLNAGSGNNDFDIHRTPDGFTAFVPSTVAYYPVRTWKADPAGVSWQEVPSEFNNIQFSDNLGDRIFLFASNYIAELQDKDLALTLPSLAPATLGVGDTVSANVTVTNLGRAIASTGSWKVTARLAKNRFFGDTKNVLLGTADITTPMPAPGTSQSYPVSFTLPNQILTGTNFLILTLSGPADVIETNTANNTIISDTAVINIPEWEFSVATNGNGQVNRDFAALRYPHKSQVSLTASAGKGAAFTGWGGDALGAESQITVLMDGNKSVQANFSNRATLQIFVRGAGLVTGLPDLGSYPVGQTAAITAAPAPGWEFSHWSGASAATTPMASILMNAPKTATANFVLPMAAWKNSHFNPTELADPNISGDDMDPDKDGVPSWKEYLHGSHPMDKDSTGAGPLTMEGGFLRCIYTRNLGAANGASVTCQAGRTLSDWNTPDLQERILSTTDGIETIEARIPTTGQGKGFFRFMHVRGNP